MGFMAVVPMLVSAASAAAAGIAASNAANYQAQVAKNNAEMSAQKQKMIVSDYAQRQETMAMQDKAKMGGMQTQIAAGGLDPNTGSSKGVMAGEQAVLGQNRLAHATAFGEDWYSEKAHQISAQAQEKLDRMQADNARTTGFLGAASSLVSGGSKNYQQYGSIFGDLSGYG
jgi:hypothetical protein